MADDMLGSKAKKLQMEAEKAGKKTEAARKKLPKKTEYSLERVFDEKTGKAKYKLKAVKKEKQFKPDSPVKKAAGRAGAYAAGYAHGKISEVEGENSSVEAAHKMEQKVEEAGRIARRYSRTSLQKKHEKVAKLENRQFKKEARFEYQKFMDENPQLKGNKRKKQLQKKAQKRRYKREYIKARRNGQATARAGEKAAKKVQEIAARNVSVLATVGVFALIAVMVMTALSSCGAMFSDGMGVFTAGSWQSEPAEIDAAELYMTQLEMLLQEEIDNIETDYPDYDEYRYDLGDIGHNPFDLINYLSAVYTKFTSTGVAGEIDSLFSAMYELTLTPTTETRTRTVEKKDASGNTIYNENGDPETEEEEYTVSILEVTLSTADLDVLVADRMDDEQKEICALYGIANGLLQYYYSPLSMDWSGLVSSYYGYRINPITGQEQLHKGVDIAVATGTAVYAAQDGVVKTAGYSDSYGNYVVIENSDGYSSTYAHLDSIAVNAGQEVEHGTQIGLSGNTGNSTGSHLHIECAYNGVNYNPLFYFLME